MKSLYSEPKKVKLRDIRSGDIISLSSLLEKDFAKEIIIVDYYLAYICLESELKYKEPLLDETKLLEDKSLNVIVCLTVEALEEDKENFIKYTITHNELIEIVKQQEFLLGYIKKCINEAITCNTVVEIREKTFIDLNRNTILNYELANNCEFLVLGTYREDN